ncbi:hypothetical protein [Nannocystis pusilla]|uniref:hypothetical protein n=1 Tax=Nannocystis pusilla TaxID=889268 RepID=UPI003B7D9019
MKAREIALAQAPDTVSMGPITALHRGFAAGLVLSLAAVSATSERAPDEAEGDVDDGTIDAHAIVQVDDDFTR